MTDKDKLMLKNLIKILEKAYFKELSGPSALAFTAAYEWVIEQYKAAMAPPPPPPAPMPMPIDEPIVLSAPEPEKPKKSRKK